MLWSVLGHVGKSRKQKSGPQDGRQGTGETADHRTIPDDWTAGPEERSQCCASQRAWIIPRAGVLRMKLGLLHKGASFATNSEKPREVLDCASPLALS